MGERHEPAAQGYESGCPVGQRGRPGGRRSLASAPSVQDRRCNPRQTVSLPLSPRRWAAPARMEPAQNKRPDGANRRASFVGTCEPSPSGPPVRRPPREPRVLCQEPDRRERSAAASEQADPIMGVSVFRRPVGRRRRPEVRRSHGGGAISMVGVPAELHLHSNRTACLRLPAVGEELAQKAREAHCARPRALLVIGSRTMTASGYR